MSAPKTVYRVEVLDTIDGKKTWRTLLSTHDHEQAKALVAAMEQDGVKAQIEVTPPKSA